MSRCSVCADRGVVKVQYRENPGAVDLASCTCDAGKVFRKRGMLRAWAASHGFDLAVTQIGRLEEYAAVEPKGA